MAGRRGKNLRSGDLNEELGILLLKGIAAVARVPREDDVGIDAVATLLRDGGDGILYAEDTFYVQIKSESVERIDYTGEEVDWLKALKLSLFLGRVDGETGHISLYSTTRLSQILMEYNYQTLRLFFDDAKEGDDPESERAFGIGRPRLRWSLPDLRDTAFRERARQMIKTVVETEHLNHRHRGIKHAELLKTETNVSAEPNRIMMMGRCYLEEAQILEEIAPYIRAVMFSYHSFSQGDPRDDQALNLFIEYMARHGVPLMF